MASEQHGPTPTRQLEPPGFLALNYGRRTPISVLVAHLVYGAILGAFYRLKQWRLGMYVSRKSRFTSAGSGDACHARMARSHQQYCRCIVPSSGASGVGE